MKYEDSLQNNCTINYHFCRVAICLVVRPKAEAV